MTGYIVVNGYKLPLVRGDTAESLQQRLQKIQGYDDAQLPRIQVRLLKRSWEEWKVEYADDAEKLWEQEAQNRRAGHSALPLGAAQ